MDPEGTYFAMKQLLVPFGRRTRILVEDHSLLKLEYNDVHVYEIFDVQSVIPFGGTPKLHKEGKKRRAHARERAAF